MTAPPSIRPPSQARRSLWRRGSFWLVVLLLVAASGVAGWLWQRNRVPDALPPDVDLRDADPAIAEAIEKKRQQILHEPRSGAAWGALGQLLSAFNYRPEALICLAQAERLDPREPRWPYHQGILLLLDNPREAVPRFERAVDLSGAFQEAARLRLGETLLSLGRLDEAEAQYRLLKERDADNARVRLGLGRIAAQRGQWKEAEENLEAAARDATSARSASIALVELYQRHGESERAESLRARIEKLPPDARWNDPFMKEIHALHLGKRFRSISANRLFEQGHREEALAQMRQLVLDYPQSKEVWLGLGQALRRAGAYPQAEQALQKAVELSPGYAEAYNELGSVQFSRGKLKDAETALRKTIELKPDCAVAHVNLGRCLFQQRDPARAIEAFRCAVRSKPDFLEAYLELAAALHQTQRDDEAREQIQQALRLYPDNVRAKQMLEKMEPNASSKK